MEFLIINLITNVIGLSYHHLKVGECHLYRKSANPLRLHWDTRAPSSGLIAADLSRSSCSIFNMTHNKDKSLSSQSGYLHPPILVFHVYHICNVSKYKAINNYFICLDNYLKGHQSTLIQHYLTLSSHLQPTMYSGLNALLYSDFIGYFWRFQPKMQCWLQVAAVS